MRQLLAPKEVRICSKAYKFNDCFRLKRPATTSPIGHFVYPNDAEDIKSHAFFKGIDWLNLHLMTPPHIPKVESATDTRYFEDPVSDASSTIYEDELLVQEELEQEIVSAFEEGANGRGAVNGNGKAVDGNGKTVDEKADQKNKRPRDRMLRDKSISKEVMELRKQGAFVGYAYRRPYC